MRNVLITNLYLQKYTGSELHVIDIANEFKKKGYEVTIAVFSKSYPLLAECNAINVVELTDKCLDETKYDILFIQHYPTLDYLKTHYHIKYKYLIISKLSSFNGFETLPDEYKQADLISVVSQECKDTINHLTDNIFIFKNSVSNKFFESKKKENYTLKNIAIISNHVPEEIYELTNLMQDYNIQFIGAGNTPTLVTPNLLSSFDLVITIGRTVQQCFAASIPVYVYDHFGGPGYITQENIKKAQDYNFSGRGFQHKNPQDILNDIIENYNGNLNNLQFLHDYAKNHFNLSKTFENMLTFATKKTKETFNNLACYVEPECTRIKTYTEMMPFTPYIHNDYLNESQIYYLSEDNTLNENNSITWKVTNGYKIEININLTSHSFFRFDPAKKPCKCKLLEIIIDGKEIDLSNIKNNSICSNGHYDLFISSDSNYYIDSEIKKEIQIKYIVLPLTNEDTEYIYMEQQHKYMEQQHKFDELSSKYDEIYRKTHPLQTLYKQIKAHH